MKAKYSVEIRDLDGLSADAEVIEAFKKAINEIPGKAGSLKVWLTKPIRSDQRVAVAKLGDKYSNKLLSFQHVSASP